jgi:hypothetical protein
MKKDVRRLVLSKDSLRKLTRESLKGVEGDSPIYSIVICPSVPPLCA